LFTGPRGVGKTTSARLLAKAVNCLNRGEGNEPCNTCDACNEVTEARSLDVVEMDAASNTGVDNVRENIIENVRFAPSSRKFKVYIIDEVHMLSTSAFNALLKTLEEPPAHALFILATTEAHKVPQTISLRCQRFDFRRIPTNALVGRLKKLSTLEGVNVADDVLNEVARHAEGSQRDAESLLAQILALGEKEISLDTASLVLPASNLSHVLDLAEFLSMKDAASAVALVNILVNDGVDVRHFIEDSVDYFRLLMLAILGGSDQSLQDFSEDAKQRSKALVGKFSPEELTRLLDLLVEARQGYSMILQLPLELAIVKYCEREKPENQNNDIGSEPEKKQQQQEQGWGTNEAGEKPAFHVPESDVEPVSPQELKEVLASAEIALPQTTGNTVTFKTVQGKWDEIFDRVTDAHTSLGFLLKSSTLLGMDGDKLRLGFSFKFHADTLNSTKNRLALESVFTNVLGSQVHVAGEYVHADSDQVVGDLEDGLGGKLVN